MNDQTSLSAVPLTFDVTVTLEDQLALQMRCLAAPAMRAGRFKRAAITVLIAAALSPIFVVLGILIAWLGDQRRTSFGDIFRPLILDDPSLLAIAVAVMVAASVCGAVCGRWFIRPRLRRMLRRILRARPDVDPADPHLAFRAQVTVDDEGLQSRTAAGTTLVPWTMLKRWEETGGRIMVLGDAMTGFCLPASAAPSAATRLRTILTARLGPPT